MDNEELRLLRENNYMLKLIILYINTHGHLDDFKELMINVMANSI